MTQTKPQTDSRPAITPQPKDPVPPPADDGDTLGPGPIPTTEYPPEIPDPKPKDDTISDNERYYRHLAETLDATLNLPPHEETKC